MKRETLFFTRVMIAQGEKEGGGGEAETLFGSHAMGGHRQQHRTGLSLIIVVLAA